MSPWFIRNISGISVTFAKSLRHAAAVSMAAAGKADPTREGDVGGGEDAASCSCVEGNPCVSPYNCKNWEKRFEIAKKARSGS